MLLSGNGLYSFDSAFLSRCASICLRACPVSAANALGITAGSSILAITLTALPHASQVDISISPKAPTFGEYSFQTLSLYALGCSSSRHAAPQEMAHRRLSGAWCSCLVLLVLLGHDACYSDGPAPLCPAGAGEHAVESSQVSPGLRHQGSKPSHEIQWLEDDVGSAIPIRCLQLIADVADWRKRKPLFRNRRTADVSSGPPADRRSSFLRSSVLAATPACSEKPDALPAVSA